MTHPNLAYEAVLNDIVERYNESLNIAAAQDQMPPGNTDYERALKMLTMSQASMIQAFAAAMAENNRKLLEVIESR